MGINAPSIHLRCYFWDDGAGHETYDTYKTLVGLLKTEDKFNLVHPDYGTLEGNVGRVSIRHDDRQRTAEVDIEFIQGTHEAAPEVADDIQGKAETAYENGLAEAQDSLERTASEVLGAEASEITDHALDPDQDILSQFTGISRTAREYVKKADAFERELNAALSHISTPANAFVSTIDFAADLPGRIISAAAHVADRYSRLYDTVTSAPDRFIQSFKDGIEELEESLTLDDDDDTHDSFRTAFRSIAALEGGVKAGAAFSEDEENRRLLKRLENTKRFDALGNYLNPGTEPYVMNVREIETTLYTARELIQSAIDLDRSNDSLKALARSLLIHVNEIKLNLAQIVTVNIDNELPIHLVCLRYGLPYTMAERLLAINDISDPNFIRGEMNIYFNPGSDRIEVVEQSASSAVSNLNADMILEEGDMSIEEGDMEVRG
jgi:prophage DNA circulation protein